METKTLQKGRLLIARPSMMSDVFSRSVILLTDHSENGTVGFVLNKSLEIPVSKFISGLNSLMPVYEGGPVDQENIYYIHKRPDLISDSEKFSKGLYWSGNYEDVQYAVNNGLITEDEIRFYLGYSGWSAEQLQGEINNNAWTLIRDENLDIFNDWTSDLWKNEMKKLGGENLIWMNMPENPLLN